MFTNLMFFLLITELSLNYEALYEFSKVHFVFSGVWNFVMNVWAFIMVKLGYAEYPENCMHGPSLSNIFLEIYQ